MTPFDERFADRAREVFDDYAEPVDEPTWARVQGTLEKDRLAARDRPPVANSWARRSRAVVALAMLVLAAGVGTWALWPTPTPMPETGSLAMNTDAMPGTSVRPPSPARAASPAPASPTPPALEHGDASSSQQSAPAAASPAGPALSARQALPVPARRLEAARAQESIRSDLDAVSAPPATRPSSAARMPPPAAPAPTPAADVSQNALVEGSGLPARDELTTDAPSMEPRPTADLATDDELAIGDRSRESGSPESGSTEEASTGDRFADAAPSPIAQTRPAVTRTAEAEGSALAAEPESSRMGVDLVLATNAALSGRQLAEGAGVTAGLSREWRVRRGVAVSAGALAAYTRLATDPDASAAEALTSFESDPSQAVEIPSQTTLSTLALEVPLDVIVDVTRAGSGRIRAGVGLTTSLYLSQTFEDEGTRYALDPAEVLTGGGTQITTTAYADRETAGPLSRLDLGRQANASLGYTLDRGRRPLSLDAYTRLPLGGLTSRDLPLTVLGVRLRVGL